MNRHSIAIALVFLANYGAIAAETPALFPAFPGAEGAGAFTPGGRGGRTLIVTTLADYMPGKEPPIRGSLRWALGQRGPRTIQFRVGGYIDLKTNLYVAEPFVTIAAQTAPGDGVCLRHSSLVIATHDVVLRHLRVRPGDVQGRELDAISLRGQNAIFDHCSATWGIDETISTNGDSADVTVQHCLIAESLNRSVHHKGAHGYGSLISGPGEISYHHNLYALHRSRNPRAGDVRLDFRNNVVAGWGDRAGYSGDDALEMNYVGNVLRPFAKSKNADYGFLPGSLRPRIFLAGNVLKAAGGTPPDQTSLLRAPDKTKRADLATVAVPQPFATASVETQPAEAAWTSVLQNVGATRPARDAVDRRIVEQVREGRGTLINSQTEVGGWPELKGGEAPADADSDGMPDAWEAAHQLEPKRASKPAADADRDGYTDLEEFCNGTDPNRPEAWVAPPRAIAAGEFEFLDRCELELAGAAGDTLRYTLDGSEPGPGSPAYRGPIVVERSAVLRAKAFRGSLASPVRNVPLTKLEWKPAVDAAQPKPGVAFDYFESDDEPAWEQLAALPARQRGVAPTINLEPRIREKRFGFRYAGLISAPRDGVYRFFLRCSPRGALTVDGAAVENTGKRREHAMSVALRTGLHPIAYQTFYKSDVDKTLDIHWQGPELPRRPLAVGDLFVSQAFQPDRSR